MNPDISFKATDKICRFEAFKVNSHSRQSTVTTFSCIYVEPKIRPFQLLMQFSFIHFAFLQVCRAVGDFLHLFITQTLRTHGTHLLCFQQPGKHNNAIKFYFLFHILKCIQLEKKLIFLKSKFFNISLKNVKKIKYNFFCTKFALA